MKWLHEGQGAEPANHILVATCRAIRLAKASGDDVQFVYKGIPILVDKDTQPKRLTPRFQQAILAGDANVIDARVGVKQAHAFRPLKAAICLALAAFTATV